MEIVAPTMLNDTIPPLYNITNDGSLDAFKTMKVNDGFGLVGW